jgi:regulator of sigma E protease
VLSALPLGGYVRMLDEREGDVHPDELHRAFNRKPLWQRSAIVAAGPIANLLLAVALYSGAHWIGVEEPRALVSSPPAGSMAEQAGLRAGDLVQAWSENGVEWDDVRSMPDLTWRVTQAALRAQALHLMVTDAQGRGQRRVLLSLDQLAGADVDAAAMRRIGLGQALSEPVLGPVTPAGAGDKAGLRQGDRVLSIDGRSIIDAAMVRDAIRASGRDGKAVPMAWRVERDGRMLDIEVLAAVASEAGATVGRLELVPGQSPQRATVRYGVVEGFTRAVRQTWDMSTLTVSMLGKMIIGQASLKNLSGPLTIADYAGQSAKLGLAYYLGFLAVVSVSLGVLNLLPLPMLDGGHLMYYLFEGVTGRPVSELWLERLQRGGVAIMLMMMSLALYNDVARLLGLH